MMMETKDPALTKTRIAETDTHQTFDTSDTSNAHPNDYDNDKIEEHTIEEKGTETFTEDVYDSEHVNKNDNPARQPDRRDQDSNGFDDNINEQTVGSEAPDSYNVNDMNRYANLDNAQTRVLNPDEKNSIR